LDALLLNPLDQILLLKVGVKFDWGRRRTLVERLKKAYVVPINNTYFGERQA
jgi:hypothetical protein